MITGTTIEKAAKEMLKKTQKQAKFLNIELPEISKQVYQKPNENYNFKSSVKIDKEQISTNTCEIKKNNRWLLKFPKEFNIPEWAVESINRPSFPFTDNKLFIVLRDIMESNISESLINYKNDAKMFKLKLNILGPNGTVIEKWRFNDCFINSINWSALNYKDDDISKIFLEVTCNDIKYKK